LPKFHSTPLTEQTKATPPLVNQKAPGFGRKAVIFATCFANYNNPDIGDAALKVLAKNGVDVEVVYPECCGMPQFEHGDLARVADKARTISAALQPYIEQGKDIIALVPSCALMMKFEWPLIVPDDENVKSLSQATYDITEYIVELANQEGMSDGLSPLAGGITLHLACHARAQNMGPKGAEMLRLIPDADVSVVERCSGHGGSWGIKKDNFEVATKFSRQTVRKAAGAKTVFFASECPLAGKHIAQGLETLDGPAQEGIEALHPIQILAKAYGLA
jgi:glycerol-3-phosphate dehydrogenase subunit C